MGIRAVFSMAFIPCYAVRLALCGGFRIILLKTKKGRDFYFPFGLTLSAIFTVTAAIGSANINPNIPNPIANNCFSDFGKKIKGIAIPSIGRDAPAISPVFLFVVIVLN